MFSIDQQLQHIRRSALIGDIKTVSWISYTFLLVVVFAAIFLESIFYFSSQTRVNLWQLFFLIIILLFIFGFFMVFLALKNHIQRYRLSTLAKKAGRLAFPKEDTVINALQLERAFNSSTSPELSKTFLHETKKQLSQLDEQTLFHSARIHHWKNGSLIILILGAFLFTIQWNNYASAVYRWAHSRTTFPVPKPFTIESISGNINLLGGDTAELLFISEGSEPDSLFLDLQPYNATTDSILTYPVIKKNQDGYYYFNVENIAQNYRYRALYPARHFWEAWKEISSSFYSISVTDRPVMEDLTITIHAPEYAHLEPQIQKGNRANIAGLLGSMLDIQLRSNRPLKNGSLIINNLSHPLKIHGKTAEGSIRLSSEGLMSIQLEDTRNISNRNPIPFHLQIIPDLFPNLSVIQPEPIMELGSDQTIPFHLQIEDDFGFSNLQIAYEIHRPAYIEAEPLLSLFSIEIDQLRNLNQDVFHFWNLNEFGLMPEDEIHYHFELSDNDFISGPKKTVSGDFIARLPGLAELFTAFENKENQIFEEINYSQDELEAIRHSLEQLELEALKQDNLTWDQQKDLKQILDKSEKEIKNLQELSEALSAIKEKADKHGLFSSDILEKFNRLQELIDEILSPELMEKMKNLDDMLQDMDFKQMQDILKDLTDNLNRVEQELDRFIDIFERIQAEQKLDELNTRIDQLVKQQEQINEQIDLTHDQTDPSTFSRLSEEEQRQVEEFSNIRNEMERAAEAVKPYNEETADRLEDLRRNPLMNQTYADLQRAVNQLQRNHSNEAAQFSESALKNLKQLQEEINKIQENFQNSTTRDMAQKFQHIMMDVLNLSKSQENLRSEIKTMPRNSPRLGKEAGQQQMHQDQLRQVMEQLMELSKETFAVTPDIGQAIGMSNAMMEEAKKALADRNGQAAAQHQLFAMKSLNETALAIHQSVNQMRSSGSASGYEQFLQRMQEMAGKQQGINDQSMQLAMGQMSAAMQQGLLQRLMKKQRQVRKSLQDIMNEMKRSGEKGLGDLSGAAKDMDEVIKDFERQQFSRKTVDRQKRILSRMLDSQTSMTQRGEKEERKSKTGTDVFSTGPSGLPLDMGQRRSLALEAMNRALKAGYSRDYQTMIRRYFSALSNNDVLISKRDSSAVQ